jgi:hypothetical protein
MQVAVFRFCTIKHSVHSTPWRYVLIPHNSIAMNKTLDGLAGQFGEYKQYLF